MKLRFWRAQRRQEGPETSSDEGTFDRRLTHRQFLKLAVGTAGAAGVALAGAAKLAEATYTPGPPDVVDTDLTVQGNLTVDDNLGIGTANPQGKLDVAGNICVNGTEAVDSSGIVKRSYYAQ